MAGRIRDEDIAAVREKASIADEVGEHVQLRNSGGGNLMGICPFHDEKSPSFSVSPARNLFHCFGCGVGGDVISFVQRIDHLSFAEAIERLAAKLGIRLHYTEGGGPARPAGQRARLIEAHTVAAAFYVEQLKIADAAPARQYLDERGFDAAAVAKFGCGYAPPGWDTLTKYLLNRGFKSEELVLAGLSREGSRSGLIDRFHRRLLWPIKDVAGDVVGFGARRIHDDDRNQSKYINTAETPLYKKSTLLYGMDMAKRDIGKLHQAVIVEGYTDVMACHLAGITTAVATCGTSFGSEHIGVIRRLLMDNDAFSGQVVFTFDGDAAGMKAAERAFADEQKFMSQTFVAIEPTGKDPCELRQSGGDPAVRSLIDSRKPLVEFVLRTTVNRFDLNLAEGRVQALDRAIPLVALIKDHALRDEYARMLAGMVGVADPNRVVARVRGLVRSGEKRESAAVVVDSAPAVGVPVKVVQAEREVIKAALQLPEVVGKAFDELGPIAFLVAVHQQLQSAIGAAGGAAAASTGPSWPALVTEQLPDGSEARSAVNALAVEPLRCQPDKASSYAIAMTASLAMNVLNREIASLQAEMQRASANGDQLKSEQLGPKLMELQRKQIEMKRHAIGGEA